MAVEPWLRGALTDVDAVRRQVLHALELTVEDAARWCDDLTDAEMNARPFGLTPVGFHLRHIVRSLDRLLTYAEGGALSGSQHEDLQTEMDPASAEATRVILRKGLLAAAMRVRAISPAMYEESRGVGRALLPSTVGGLLVHCAEHTQRHAGQAITTAKVILEMRRIAIRS